MPILNNNGTNLYYEIHGDHGDPLVFVHGSWVDHHSWDAVVARLAKHFRVLVYDRRGHSRSGPGRVGTVMADHVGDLQALMETLDFAPTHVAANSYGSIISLRLAVSRSDLFRTLIIHEPPLMTLLDQDESLRPQMELFNKQAVEVCTLLEEGKTAEGVALFVDTLALGPGQWAKLPQPARDLFIANAPTFLNEVRDPVKLGIDLDSLDTIRCPVLLTTGTTSPPLYSRVAALLENAILGVERQVFQGAGHVPQSTHQEVYVKTVREFIRRANRN
jgi:pimeloyl-ACP methyl ester carboxylesterase